MVPQGTAARKPRKWCEASAIKDKKCQENERKRAKRKFQPFNESEKGRLLDKEKITEEPQELFTEKATNSVFVLMQTKQKSPQPVRPILPVDLRNAAKGCLTADDLHPNSHSVSDFWLRIYSVKLQYQKTMFMS